MELVCLQDEIFSGKRRGVDEVIADCIRRDKENELKRKFKPVCYERDRLYRRSFQSYMWALQPQYAITLNPNFSGDAPCYSIRREEWKYIDALLHSRLVSRRFRRLRHEMRLSWVAFPEYTKTGNLHYHILLWLPARHRYSDKGLSKRRLHYVIRSIIGGILKKVFRKASVKVQAIWSKRGVNYATKCVTRSSELDWSFWRKVLAPPDANRLNMAIASRGTANHDHAKHFVPRTRNHQQSRPSFPSTAVAPEPPREAERRPAIGVDYSATALPSAHHSPTGDSAWRVNLRGNPHVTFIAAIVTTVRGWFTMRVTDG